MRLAGVSRGGSLAKSWRRGTLAAAWTWCRDFYQVGKSGNNQPAKRCGFATILSYLCYLDREVEPSIKGEGVGYNFAVERMEALDANKKDDMEDNINFIQENCHRVIKILTTASPSVGGRAYIYAAMDAGYQSMITMGKDHMGKIKIHKMAALSKRFQSEPAYKEGNDVVDPVLDKFVQMQGDVWFFCKGLIYV